MPRAWMLVLCMACTAAAQGWRVPARLQQDMVLQSSGELAIAGDGLRFTSAKGEVLFWRYADIATLDLAPRALTVVAFAPRRWRMPGLRRWRFDLEAALPPAQAARLAAALPRPVLDAVPNPESPAWIELPAYADGQNGELRFTAAGIDFITAKRGYARHFAWRDIETLTRPDRWHLGVGGFREAWAARLKQPLSAADFDRLWQRFESGSEQ
ncbi:MAG TPA: hypothetical protein VN690_13805 [Terriglobales bacterium]|nr:hypothetical protein [Terriglobales bacterium]